MKKLITNVTEASPVPGEAARACADRRGRGVPGQGTPTTLVSEKTAQNVNLNMICDSRMKPDWLLICPKVDEPFVMAMLLVCTRLNRLMTSNFNCAALPPPSPKFFETERSVLMIRGVRTSVSSADRYPAGRGLSLWAVWKDIRERRSLRHGCLAVTTTRLMSELRRVPPRWQPPPAGETTMSDENV